ncbi:MAG: ribbon-helix-helix protein, CopG family [Sphingomonadaceae bacterium]|nr:ribbon-helix-helix protein, CopG family [Sphingomonadaceae bacterium]
MASLTIRNIPEEVKARFRQLAAAHGRSMEEHMRHLIADLVRDDDRTPPVVKDNIVPDRAFRTYAASTIPDPAPLEKDWVAELRQLAAGADLRVPPRRAQKLDAPDL